VKRCVTWGLNRVDKDAPDYCGWDGGLAGCKNDAAAIVTAAALAGFECSSHIADYVGTFTTYGSVQPDFELVGAATRESFVRTFDAIAASPPGDVWVLWYSGHGSQVKYALGATEGMCFFDGILEDWAIWNQFQRIPAGVRVFFGADCCHAAGMPGTRERLTGPFNRVKSCPIRYRNLGTAPQAEKGGLKGSLAYWAGCGKNQLSLDGPQNGLFTATALSQLYHNFTYLGWANMVAAKMPPHQQPELQYHGPKEPWTDKTIFT